MLFCTVDTIYAVMLSCNGYDLCYPATDTYDIGNTLIYDSYGGSTEVRPAIMILFDILMGLLFRVIRTVELEVQTTGCDDGIL